MKDKNVQDRFSFFKIFNHFHRFAGIINNEVVYPVTVEIDPTNVCNFKCIFCNDQKKVDKTSFRIDVLFNLIDQLKACDVKSIVIKGGGEPLLYPQIEPLLYTLKEANCMTGMITNGSILYKYIDAVGNCLDWIRISLDAFSGYTHQIVHGQYTVDINKIFDSIEELIKKYPDVMVGANYVVNNHNYREILPLIVKLEKIGVKSINIRPPFLFEGEIKEEVWKELDMIINKSDSISQNIVVASQYKYRDRDTYYTNKKWDKCRATPLIGSIGADGNVYVCCALKGFKEFSFGNLNEESFINIWHGEKRQQVMGMIGNETCQKYCSDRLDMYNRLLSYLANKENQKNLFL